MTYLNKEIISEVVCPNCHEILELVELYDITCQKCNEKYIWQRETWDLIPLSQKKSDKWDIWEKLQSNGLLTYIEDPIHNLIIEKNQMALDFGDFCKLSGKVLDVGCGRQSWPSYFETHSEPAIFVGVDPLIDEPSDKYTQFRALAEYLPFKDKIFDHVIFVTSLDHFINPTKALLEAKRVCKVDGEIDIWLGEKSPNAPKSKNSPKWYLKLEKPNGADDVFHYKRLLASELKEIVCDLGFSIFDEKSYKFDEFRTVYFFRMKF